MLTLGPVQDICMQSFLFISSISDFVFTNPKTMLMSASMVYLLIAHVGGTNISVVFPALSRIPILSRFFLNNLKVQIVEIFYLAVLILVA